LRARVGAAALLAALLLCGTGALAGEEAPKRRFLLDGGAELIGAPLEAPFWEKLTLMTGAGVLVHQYDGRIARALEKKGPRYAENLSDAGRALGDGLLVAPALAAGWLLGAWTEDERLVKASRIGLESFAFGGLAVNALKYTTHRRRPKAGDGPNRWGGMRGGSGNLSFPSGHAATAFSWAASFALVYGDTWWVGPLCYGGATLTALSRVHDREHWGSDVVFGSLLGYFTSRALVSLEKNGVKTAVLPGPGGPTLALTMAF